MSLKPKILIADDSAMNRAILVEMLGDGYDVIEAENGREAVRALQSAPEIDLTGKPHGTHICVPDKPAGNFLSSQNFAFTAKFPGGVGSPRPTGQKNVPARRAHQI